MRTGISASTLSACPPRLSERRTWLAGRFLSLGCQVWSLEEFPPGQRHKATICTKTQLCLLQSRAGSRAFSFQRPLCHMTFQGECVDICSSSPTANLQKHRGDPAQHRRRELLGIHLVFANRTSGINNTSAGVRSSAQLGRLTSSDSALSGQRDGGLHQSGDRSSRRHTCLCRAHLCHGHHRRHVSMQRLPLIPLSRFFQAPAFFILDDVFGK